jgi:hypothetical protein
MVNWDDMKKKLTDIGDVAKKGFSAAADKTQKGAKVASLRVKIVMEENKINKNMGELGRKVYDLLDKGETSVAGNSLITGTIKAIKDSKKTISSINQEIDSIK